MIKRIGAILIFLVIAVAMFVFTDSNPGTVQLDLILGTVEASIPLAFTLAFATGWIFGILCAAVFMIRLVNERRQLRKSLRLAEAEVSSLRSLPISDAD
jgi:putative membrane protein